MNFKKVLALVLVLVTVLTTLSGCGAKKEEVSKEAKQDVKEITIMTEKSSHAEAWKSVIPEFEKQFNAKVNVVELPWEQYRQQLNLKFTGGKVDFDLAYIPVGWVPELQSPDYITPVEDCGNVDELGLEDFAGIENGYFGDNHKLYFVPYMIETHGILYRTDLFEDQKEKDAFKEKYGYELGVPKTIKQYKDVAEFFNRPDEGINGVTLMGDKSILLGFHFYNRLFNYGGDIFDKDYHTAFNNEAGIKALNDLKELFGYTSDAAKQYSWMDASGEFLQGRSAMAEMATTIAQVAQDENQSKVVGKVGFAGVPLFEEGQKDVKRLYLPFGFVVTKDSAAKDLAFNWIKFVTNKDQMEKAAPIGNIPARYSVLEGKLSEQFSYYKPHAEIMKNSRLEPLPLIPEGAAVTSDIIPAYISQFLNGELTDKEALEGAAKEVEEMMQQSGYYK